ncbi:transcription termination/antitermination protein NusA [Patescibacteria group bacterium]|nr:transcription termination/antitermination protein NusA [Patescibacteria group bacterium]
MAKQGNEILEAAKIICEEKKISLESVIETIAAALAVAYRKDFGEKNENIKVEFDIEGGNSKVFDVKTVVTDEKAELTEKLRLEQEESEQLEVDQDKSKKTSQKSEKPLKEAKEQTKDTEENEEEKFERFNPKTEITLSDAKKIKKTAKLDDEIKTELKPPAAYGRMAAQTAKQVIIQRLREAEREMIYKEFKDKEGEVINGTVQRLEGRMVLIDLGQATAILPPPEQVPSERYSSGQRLKFFVVAVNTTSKGPEIVLSRAHVEMVRKLFFLEVPEIGNGSVEIKSIAREAGSRTKIAVFTDQKNIDPVGSCVGQRGSRVQTIISEIGGEKIDIIEWDIDPVKFIINALSPAKVLNVKINEEEKTAMAEVKEDQLSLAIGKAGQNVRLSAKLTGWKIDIVSESSEKVSAQDDKTKDATDDKADSEKEDSKSAPEKQPEDNEDKSADDDNQDKADSEKDSKEK